MKDLKTKILRILIQTFNRSRRKGCNIIYIKSYLFRTPLFNIWSKTNHQFNTYQKCKEFLRQGGLGYCYSQINHSKKKTVDEGSGKLQREGYVYQYTSHTDCQTRVSGYILCIITYIYTLRMHNLSVCKIRFNLSLMARSEVMRFFKISMSILLQAPVPV